MSTTENEIERQRAELATTLTQIKGTTATLETKVAAVEGTLTAMRQLQDAYHREAVERKAGPEAEALEYLAKSVPGGIAADDRGKYLANDAGAIRLRGHWVEYPDPTGGQAVRSWEWGLLDDPEPRTKAQLRLQQEVTLRNMARNLTGRKFSPALDRRVRRAAEELDPRVARIFADSSGIGADWIPDNVLPELERRITVPTNLAAIFPRRVMRPGTTKIPTITSRIRWYKHAIPTVNNPPDATLSDLATGMNTFDPVPTVAAIQADRDALADSMIDFAAMMIQEFADSFRFAEDDAVVNGDTSASHQDTIASWNTRGRLGSTGLGTTADHRRKWLGLRPRAYDLTSMTTDQNAVQTFDGLRTALGKLSPDSMIQGYATGMHTAVLTSWEYFFAKMLDWDEFASFDRVGALASILTGQLGDSSQMPGGFLPGQVGLIHGFIPVILTYPLTGDLNATGLFTGSGSTTGMLQVDRSRFEYVIRQGMTLESDVEIRNNTATWVARARTLFRGLDAVGSTVKDVHYSYNLTY